MDTYRYPIGTFQMPSEVNEEIRTQWIHDISTLPDRLRKAVEPLTEEQLRTPYREQGWTVKQLVHHIADSHINAYVRLKLTLTEENPTIKPYNEALWSELPDSDLDVKVSLQLLESLHKRFVALFQSLSTEDFNRTLLHPENGVLSIMNLLGLYAWHGNHHLAHITSLSERMGW